jgi:hypothetical protein
MLQPKFVSAECFVTTRTRYVAQAVTLYLLVIAPMMLQVFQVLQATIKLLVAASAGEHTACWRRTVSWLFW